MRPRPNCPTQPLNAQALPRKFLSRQAVRPSGHVVRGPVTNAVAHKFRFVRDRVGLTQGSLVQLIQIRDTMISHAMVLRHVLDHLDRIGLRGVGGQSFNSEPRMLFDKIPNDFAAMNREVIPDKQDRPLDAFQYLL